jgi:hypothetical protein
MGEGRTEAATVQVDDVLALVQGEDDALIESIGTASVDEPESAQYREGMTLRGERAAQRPAGCIADVEIADQHRIMQSAGVEIAECFGVVFELLLIENSSLFEHSGRAIGRSGLLIQAGEALTERQMAGQLDKANQIAALSATVAIENILVRVGIKRGLGLLVQRTESDELGMANR